mmetsp:Transcript_15073/g.17542  ORF Transcript_15073/g.17542 Transcript_15073/m.17542 type:complete len:456 (-) Transcript_15073:94-1461(-)
MNLKQAISTILLLSVSAATTSATGTDDKNGVEIALLVKAKTTALLTETKSLYSAEKLEAALGLRSKFVTWMNEFGMVYESVEEELSRMLVWVENHEFIEQHNNKVPEPSYTVAHNKFSGMTNDEFQRLHSLGKYSAGVDAILEAQKREKELKAMQRLNNQEDPAQAEFRYLRKLAQAMDGDSTYVGYYDDDGDDWFFADDDGNQDDDDNVTPTDDSTDDDATPATDDNDTDGLPDEIDWIKSGAVTPVKNQGRCGSCWAFSSTGAIEGASYIKYGELVALSEQNLIDCDRVDQGCNGGLMDNAFKFDEAAHGLCSEDDYPYLATDGNICNTNCTKVTGTTVKDYIDLEESDKHGLIAAVVMQPTSIAMQADQLSFQFYSTGVFDDDDCGAEGNIDHGVLMVGYGTDTDTGKKYFKIKNSWGGDWGEDGYIRIHRESKNQWGMCAILRVMTVPIIA